MSDIMIKNGFYPDKPDEPLEELLKGSVGPGWFPLVRRLVDDLIAAGWNRELAQIKEKFGGLRFYTFEGNHEMFELICAAEEESLRTCDECGEPGKQCSPDGWLLTRCDNHTPKKRK